MTCSETVLENITRFQSRSTPLEHIKRGPAENLSLPTGKNSFPATIPLHNMCRMERMTIGVRVVGAGQFPKTWQKGCQYAMHDNVRPVCVFVRTKYFFSFHCQRQLTVANVNVLFIQEIRVQSTWTMVCFVTKTGSLCEPFCQTTHSQMSNHFRRKQNCRCLAKQELPSFPALVFAKRHQVTPKHKSQNSSF